MPFPPQKTVSKAIKPVQAPVVKPLADAKQQVTEAQQKVKAVQKTSTKPNVEEDTSFEFGANVLPKRDRPQNKTKPPSKTTLPSRSPFDPKATYYAPGGVGVNYRGDFYQGGEPLPKLTPEEYEEAVSKGIDIHSDADRAKKHFLRAPLGTGDEPPPVAGIGQKAKTAAYSAEQGLPPELMQFVDEHEKGILEKLTKKQVTQFVDFFNDMISPSDEARFARLGIAKRGWYKNSANALSHLFGDEAPRFVGVLAATSPNVPVNRNLEIALATWDKWQDFKKETPNPSPQDVVAFVEGISFQQPNPVKGFLPAYKNNVARVLMADSNNLGATVSGVLSGPKVESFRKDLLGNLFEVTNDTWQASLKGVPHSSLGGQKFPKKQVEEEGPFFKSKSGKDWRYIAASIGTRMAAEYMNKYLKAENEPNWTPVEIQETGWSALRAIAEASGSSRKTDNPLTAIQALHKLTHGDVNETGDFLTLLLENSGSKALLQKILGPDGKPLIHAVNQLRKQNEQAEGSVPKESLGQTVVPSDLTDVEKESLYPIARRAGARIGAYLGPLHRKQRDRRTRIQLRKSREEVCRDLQRRGKTSLTDYIRGFGLNGLPRDVQERIIHAIKKRVGKVRPIKKARPQRNVGKDFAKAIPPLHKFMTSQNTGYHPKQFAGKIKSHPSEYGDEELDYLRRIARLHLSPYTASDDEINSVVNHAMDTWSEEEKPIKKAKQAPGFSATPMPAPKPALIPTEAPEGLQGKPAPMPAPTATKSSEERAASLFASPNVYDLTFDDAYKMSHSGQQKAFKGIVGNFLKQQGIKASTQDGIGEWSDGAENSVVQEFHEPHPPERMEYIAAWYGLLGNQKAVLTFQPSRDGTDSMYTIEVPEHNIALLRKQMSEHGISFRTIIPRANGIRVIVYDKGRKLRDKVSAFAGVHGASISESTGVGKFLGSDTRTAARKKYRDVIDAYESRNGSGGRVQAVGQAKSSGNVGPATGQQEGPVKKARGGVNAPAGGVIVRGIFYPGGKYIPNAELEKSNYDQYDQVTQRRAKMSKASRSDGSFDFERAQEASSTEDKLKKAKGCSTPAKREIGPIEKSEEAEGKSPKKAKEIAYATENKQGKLKMSKRDDGSFDYDEACKMSKGSPDQPATINDPKLNISAKEKQVNPKFDKTGKKTPNIPPNKRQRMYDDPMDPN
jgi:hypothetical protein